MGASIVLCHWLFFSYAGLCSGYGCFVELGFVTFRGHNDTAFVSKYVYAEQVVDSFIICSF